MNIATEKPETSTHVKKDRFRNLAFVIGINNYNNEIAPLKTAVNDAKKLSKILEKEHGYKVEVLLDENATLSKLNHLLEKVLPEEVKENDRLLFYFAGHGIAIPSEDDGPVGYLIPQDAIQGKDDSYLKMTTLHDRLIELPCRHFLGILDCCFAGALRWSSTRVLTRSKKGIYEEQYKRFLRYPAWKIISSSASDQKASDFLKINTERGQIGEHSPFATALFQALKGAADTSTRDTPADGVITVPELDLYLRNKVEILTEKHGQRQTPGSWPLKKHGSGEYIFYTPGHELNFKPAPKLDESTNPYRGLESFDIDDSEFFFGRSELVDELQDFVKTHSLTVVLGASGSGKSSLVKAGLIPKLGKETKEETTDKWFILSPIRPGEKPFEALNYALSKANLPKVELQNQQQTLTQCVAVWVENNKNNPNSKLLIFIDQSEELITLCKNEKERKEFFQQILTAIDNHRDKLRVVLTLRSDFEPQVRDAGLKFMPESMMKKVGDEELKNRWQNGRFFVRAMTREQLREAIEKPAEKKVLYFEPPGLIEKLIDQVDNMPGGLPLLSFALSELYLNYLNRQKEALECGEIIDRALNQEDYDELGGVMQSLTKRADEEYQKLIDKNSAYEQVIRHVMLRMVALTGGELARRRVPLSELEYPEEKNILRKEVIDRFSDARLLVKGRDAQRNSYVEPAHDALIKNWDKLRDWLQEEEENVILQRRLTPAVVDWKSAASQQEQVSGFQRQVKPAIDWLDRKLTTIENFFDKINPRVDEHFMKLWNGEQSQGKKSQLLWNGSFYLDKLDDTLKSDDNWLNNAETEFIEKSVVRKQQNHNWRWRIAIAVMLGLSGLILWALLNLRNAQIQTINALIETTEGNLLSNNQLDAMISSIKAAKKMNNFLLVGNNVSDSVLSNLQQAFYSNQNGFRQRLRLKGRNIVFSPDSSQLATVEDDNIVRRWDSVGKPLAELRGHSGNINRVVFSPDSKLIATAATDGVRLWNATGKCLGKLGNHSSNVSSVAFSPNGELIATAASDGTVKLWNTAGEQLVKLQGKYPNNMKYSDYKVNNVLFSPDNKLVAVFSQDEKVQLWDTSGKKLTELGRSVRDVKFSPDGKLIVTGESSGNATRLWDTTGKELAELRGSHSSPVYQVLFSSDNELIANVSLDGTAQLWDIQGNKLVKLNGLTGGTDFSSKNLYHPQDRFDWKTIGFDPENKIVAAASDDGTAKLWNIKGKQLGELGGHSGTVLGVVFSPDGKQVASIGEDNTINLWDITESKLAQLQGYSSNYRNVAFSPNSKLIASISDDTARLWSTTDKNLLELKGHSGKINHVAFSPNGKFIATASSDKTARLWNISGKQLAKLSGKDISGGFTSVVFSPNSRLVLTATSSNKAWLWDTTGKELAELRGLVDNVNSVSVVFSPNGKLIAGTSGQKFVARKRIYTLGLWDTTGKQIASLEKHSSNIFYIAFSPDSKLIATASGDNTARLWHSTGEPKAVLEGHSGYVRNVAFSPDGKLIATASDDRTVRLWDTSGKELHVIRGNFGSILSLEFSPDSKRLVAGLSGNASIWDITGRHIAQLRGHTNSVRSAVFSPDGKLVATGSWDKTVKLWQVGDIQEMLTISCDWINPYLKGNPNLSKRDRNLCD